MKEGFAISENFDLVCSICKTKLCPHYKVDIACDTSDLYTAETIVRRERDGKYYKEALIHWDGRVEFIPLENGDVYGQR